MHKRMAERPNSCPTELAHRSCDGLEVTLLWAPATNGHDDRVVVCVCDRRQGAYFEIQPQLCLALDAYYHPYAYRDLSTVDCEDNRLAA
jgi:hypothetical protein